MSKNLLDQFLADLVVRHLADATPQKCEECIVGFRSLFEETTEDVWADYRHKAKLFPWLDLNYDLVVDALSKNRPDLLAAIASTRGGVGWLEAQVATVRVKLGLNGHGHDHYYVAQ